MNFPVILEKEFKTRIKRFKQKMSDNKLDLVVIYSNLLDPSSVRYLSDVSPINESAAIVIPLEGEPILCSGQACHEWSKFKSKIKDVRILPEVGEVSGVEYDIEDQMDFKDLFKEIKTKYYIKKIGIIGELIFPYVIYRKLESVFENIQITNCEQLIYELRMQKSKDERECIKKAGRIISDTFSFAVDRIKPGYTELDIQADIESQMLKLGAEAYCNSFAPMVPSGNDNSNLCMNRNTLRKISGGEIVDLQAGSLYEGYNAVICAPFVLGKIPQEIKDAVKAAFEAEKMVVDAMKPGATSIELFEVYNNFLKKERYEKFSPYGSVHSLGMLECESPFFSSKKEVVMLEDMAIAIDVYFKGMSWGSFRIEDTYIIKKNGAELVTSFNEKFIPENFF
ncbi:MAG: Xaa-Pro peptidase family protein [Actinobacteria bacterium]|nr:Xaa-Pro peptidase family protein [Actinomycetota bacterium]